MRPRDSGVHVSGEQLNDSTWQVVIEKGQARLLPPAARVASPQTRRRPDRATEQPGLDRRGFRQRGPAGVGRRLVGG